MRAREGPAFSYVVLLRLCAEPLHHPVVWDEEPLFPRVVILRLWPKNPSSLPLVILRLWPKDPSCFFEQRNLRGILRDAQNDTASQRRYNPAAVKTYAVYIMTGASGVLYIGVTNDLEIRVLQHKSKSVPGFTARYNLTKLVYFEFFNVARHAIAREKQLKGWLRKRKVALVESTNPTWSDLSPPWVQKRVSS